MKLVHFKMHADPAMSGPTKFVRVREGFENHVNPESVSFKSDTDRATRFDTWYQATLWHAALSNDDERIDIIEVTS
ncbi:MAG TPA: hypothetical protein VKE94_07090 [Gemmataceae bacterium]|nr:hypothetical protein [Gemmataceae bacterium]